jgi:hypothetical protein
VFHILATHGESSSFCEFVNQEVAGLFLGSVRRSALNWAIFVNVGRPTLTLGPFIRVNAIVPRTYNCAGYTDGVLLPPHRK